MTHHAVGLISLHICNSLIHGISLGLRLYLHLLRHHVRLIHDWINCAEVLICLRLHLVKIMGLGPHLVNIVAYLVVSLRTILINPPNRTRRRSRQIGRVLAIVNLQIVWITCVNLVLLHHMDIIELVLLYILI